MSFQTQLSVRFDPTGNGATLLEDLIWLDDESGLICVDKGFYTDFFSTPGKFFLPAFVPKVGPGRSASVLHDWIFRGHEPGRFTRKGSTKLMARAMRSVGEPEWRIKLAYAGSRLGGAKHWHG